MASLSYSPSGCGKGTVQAKESGACVDRHDTVHYSTQGSGVSLHVHPPPRVTVPHASFRPSACLLGGHLLSLMHPSVRPSTRSPGRHLPSLRSEPRTF